MRGFRRQPKAKDSFDSTRRIAGAAAADSAEVLADAVGAAAAAEVLAVSAVSAEVLVESRKNQTTLWEGSLWRQQSSPYNRGREVHQQKHESQNDRRRVVALLQTSPSRQDRGLSYGNL